jgi:succinate CoA transferase
MPMPRLTAAEAASLIRHGDTVGWSGFTPAGSPKAVPAALAERARAEHAAGRPFRIGVLTGASTGRSLDGALARADAIAFRAPYQSDPDLRAAINAGRVRFTDMHLSQFPQAVRAGVLGPVDWAVIEACDLDDRGGVVLTTAVGAAPTFAACAPRIIVECNRAHPAALRGLHDLHTPADPPHRASIPILAPGDRIGSPVLAIPRNRIVGVVETDVDDETDVFRPGDATTTRIGAHVVDVLAAEVAAGRIPADAVRLQSGVGETANAVLRALGSHPDIPVFTMYTEVIQDAVLDLIRQDRIRMASGSSLTISPEARRRLYADLPALRDRLVLRPQEITNSPEVVRRLGVIACNTALEADLGGNVNSTHVLGSRMMNGIGGSGDFTRNAALAIFVCPSTAKGGAISTIVPQVSHADHSEHSVQIIVTEQGVADLRGLTPAERARRIIGHCAHPDYRDLLLGYLARCDAGHAPYAMTAATALHRHFLRTGDMRGADLDA